MKKSGKEKLFGGAYLILALLCLLIPTELASNNYLLGIVFVLFGATFFTFSSVWDRFEKIELAHQEQKQSLTLSDVERFTANMIIAGILLQASDCLKKQKKANKKAVKK